MKDRRNTAFLVLSLIAALFLSACGSDGGSDPTAPPTPAATTDNATSITNISATLNGSVNPNGLAAEAWFEWGTSPTLATFDNTTKQPFAAGTTVQAVSAPLTGLTFGTTYYFRTVASNSSGVTKGSIGNFSTSAQRPTVTTLAADTLAATSATLRGEVNPNFLDTMAWFEYSSTDNALATFTKTADAGIGSGSAVVPTSANISGLAPGGTVYFRAAARNGAGEQKGTILTLSTSNPPPVANAGSDNTVEMGKTVTLNGTGSTTPFGTITSYLWTQVAGTAVTLDNSASPGPTFTPLTVRDNTSEVLRFQLTVTDSRSLTASDNVDIIVNWVGFANDFSTDTTGTYVVTPTGTGGGGTFTYDAIGQRVQVLTGDDNVVKVSNTIPASDNGVFTLDFIPTTAYQTHGGIWVRLVQDANNYYVISNFDYASVGSTPPSPPALPDPIVDLAQILKVVGGVVTDNVYLPVTAYAQGSTYNLKITFSSTQVVLEGFGAPVTLDTTDTTAISATSMEIETGQQDAYYDNIKLVAHP